MKKKKITQYRIISKQEYNDILLNRLLEKKDDKKRGTKPIKVDAYGRS